MKKRIMVKCITGFKVYKNNTDELKADVVEGKIYYAVLSDDTGEYFSVDSQGREFLVGELNSDGGLVLEKEFELF